MFNRARSTIGSYNDRLVKRLNFLLLLRIILLGKQVINNAQEILIPKFKAWWQNHSVIKKEEKLLEK